jgi:HAD superfamily hydrolase (TIGR01509 family)
MDAIIFDMDGVISDTERLHGIAESNILSAYGITLTPEQLTNRFAGVPENKVWEILFSEWNIPMPEEQVLRDAKFNVLSSIATGNVVAIPGSIELLLEAQAAEIPCGIASSSRREFIDIVTTELDIHQRFQTLTSGTEVKNGKPAPDVFLLASERLKARPEYCAVIEDATSGSKAAKAAGMKCVGFLPPHSKQDLSAADLIVDDMTKVSLATLKSLWK